MRFTIRASTCCAAVAIALCAPSISLGQSFPSFREVDFIYTQNPQRFQSLWENARSQTVRIAVLGDSQETNPTSHGFQYMPLLNFEMWKRFGNAPETPLAGCLDYGPSPPGAWLIAGRCATPGPVGTRLSASQLLPNVRAAAFSTLNASANITLGSHGQLTILERDAAHVAPSAGIPTNRSYFDTSGVVKARIFAATNASSGEIGYKARPAATADPSYTTAVTTSGTLSLGLQSATFSIKSGVTTALDMSGEPYASLEVFGTDDSQLTDIIGLRFFNETHPEGVVIDSFSLGGYTASSFLAQHANAGPLFAALGFDAAIIHYGANDARSVSAEQFKSDISSVISQVRTWVGDATFPIVLVADVYESLLAPDRFAEYDQFVGAEQAIAQADSNVMVVNARRLTEDMGWNETNGKATQYLVDGVHYTALGAQVLSSAVVAAMMGEIHISRCITDPGAVSLDSSTTLIVDIGGVSACASYGQLQVAQALTLKQPALKVQMTNGFTPAAGDEFKLFSFATVSGSFGAVELPPLPSGLSWDRSDLDTKGSIKVIVTPAAPSPIPPTEVDPGSGTDPGTGTGSGGNGSGGPAASDQGGGGSIDGLSLLACVAMLTFLIRRRAGGAGIG